MLIAANFLLWFVVLLLSVAVGALTRQVRAMQQRIAPIAVQLAGGATPGDATPVISAATQAGEMLTLGGTSPDGRARLLLFVEGDCTICDEIVGHARELADPARLHLLMLLGAGRVEAFGGMMKRHRVANEDLIVNASIGADYRIGILPSLALLDQRGRLLARGMVQTREQLEAVLALVQPVAVAPEPLRQLTAIAAIPRKP